MRKLLMTFIFMLLLSPAALAEEDLFTTLCGLWSWVPDSPETALGGGVYFHVDGTCALYDVAGTDGEFVTALTFREAGTWTAAGDTLTLTTADGPSTYTPQVLTWQDWDYNDGMRIGGGDFLPTSPQSMEIPIESVIPQAILEHVLAFSWHDVIEDYAELPNAPGGPMAFVLIRNEERRKLDICRMTDGVWQVVEDAESAIPQMDLPYVRLTVSKDGGSYENSLWYNPEEDAYVYPEGPTLSIYTGDGEVIRESVTFVLRGDTLSLTHYGDGPNDLVDVVGDQLVFYGISGPDVRWAKYAFDSNIETVSFYALPRNAADIRISGEEEPAIPVTDWDNALRVQDVKLRTDKKYPVYMGPGKQYGRAANGKASVSTNGWVQVFGEYDGWLLVHYAISAEQYRFGWITADALAKGESVAALPFTFGDWMNNSEPLFLTDDPLNSRTALAELPQWTNLERLARLGDGYAYVRVEIGGKTWWGFVYAWPLGNG